MGPTSIDKNVDWPTRFECTDRTANTPNYNRYNCFLFRGSAHPSSEPLTPNVHRRLHISLRTLSINNYMLDLMKLFCSENYTHAPAPAFCVLSRRLPNACHVYRCTVFVVRIVLSSSAATTAAAAICMWSEHIRWSSSSSSSPPPSIPDLVVSLKYFQARFKRKLMFMHIEWFSENVRNGWAWALDWRSRRPTNCNEESNCCARLCPSVAQWISHMNRTLAMQWQIRSSLQLTGMLMHFGRPSAVHRVLREYV